jgi:hypothetical protein
MANVNGGVLFSIAQLTEFVEVLFTQRHVERGKANGLF